MSIRPPGNVYELRTRGRIEPYLTVTIPIEGKPRVTVAASTLEDERRLRDWLAHTRVVQDLPTVVEAVLYAIDDEDAA